MSLSFAAAFLMLVGKITAYMLTESSAIFSDATESVVHLFGVTLASFSLWYSRQPADRDHHYGHGKIAYLSAAGEAVIILIASVSIIYVAIDDFIHGSQIKQIDLGISIIVVLTIINFLLGNYLIKVGKKHHSVILIADGKHILTDMWTSLSVIVGITLVRLTGITWIDPVVAILVGFHIAWTAGSMLKQSYEGIMEKVDLDNDSTINDYLKEAVQKKVITSYHELRHRRVNDQIWIELHLLFPQEITLLEAHRRASEVEMGLIRCFPDNQVNVSTHLEPDSHEDSHPEGHPEFNVPA